jgi:hypothetical protein
MEDRAQRERRVIRRGTFSVVSHGTVSFCWKTGTRERRVEINRGTDSVVSHGTVSF